MLVLYSGHNPLYGLLYKCLYIELLKFHLFLIVIYISSVREYETKLTLFSLIENVGILPFHFCRSGSLTGL